ncbi:MAG TPA: hypothetical protein VIY49_05195 [Bryobacteraceae bacterium]
MTIPRVVLALSAMSASMIGSMAAQWLNHPDPKTLRQRDGKPNLSAPTPRLNGKPDLTGLWEADGTPRSELKQALPPDFFDLQIDVPNLTKYVVNLLWDFKPEQDPTRPEAAALVKQRSESNGPTSRCLPGSIPITLLLLPFKIVQTPRQIVMLFEHYDPPRQIFTDGRRLPEQLDPSWTGYATGTWQDNTLVVESRGYNDKGWLDAVGHPRSESLRLTERYRRRDFGHLVLELTVDDPKYYSRPFTVSLPFHLIPDSDVLEAVCEENEKDYVHLRN